MNSVERRYLDFDPDIMLLSAQQRSQIVKMTVLYLMRAVSSQEYSDHVRLLTKWSGRRMADFRGMLKFSGYLQREFKFYLYEYLASGTFSLSSSILKEDRAFVQRLVKADDTYQKALVRQCKAYKALGYKPRELSGFCQDLDSVMEDLRVYCKKFCIVSMRFIAESNGLKVDDLVNEIMAYGIYAVYRAYPEILDKTHLLNIAKQAAHNRGENMIKEATTQSRSRLRKHADGTFSATVVSIHSKFMSSDMVGIAGTPVQSGVMVCTGMMAGINGQSVENESAHDVDRRRDLAMVVASLFEKLASPKAKRFLELLMGTYDKEFSDWLEEPNDEFFDNVGREAYAEKVREFLNVPVHKARTFVRGLRNELQDFRN